jgi:AraC family transcriptional regulator
LLVSVKSSFIERLVDERGLPIARVEFLNRFQVCNPQIEHVGWALRAEIEASNPTGELFIDSLATALTLRLLERHSSAAWGEQRRARMAGRGLRLVLAYIEENLARALSLVEIAEVAGMGASNCKKAFREDMGVPLHQYVIQRRVDRAKEMLKNGDFSIVQVAAEAGFAHQSHLERHMQQLTGASPARFRLEVRGT